MSGPGALQTSSHALADLSTICCREVAADLSRCCAALGLVQAAVLFQHASVGASVTLQYSGIITSKLLALQRRQQCGSATAAAEQVCFFNMQGYMSCGPAIANERVMPSLAVRHRD